MNINLTLIGQSIAFAVFVWFCLRFIWPPILNALRRAAHPNRGRFGRGGRGS